MKTLPVQKIWKINILQYYKKRPVFSLRATLRGSDLFPTNCWEGRFKPQALLDEAALIACMAYVDLNPVRAKIDHTPETSAYTSIKKRINAAKRNQQPKTLYPFVGNPRENQPKGLPFKLEDYLELVDLTGRIVRQDKRGSIDLSLVPILQRLNIPSENWLTIAIEFEKHTHAAVGTELILSNYYQNAGYKRRPKIGRTKQLLAQ